MDPLKPADPHALGDIELHGLLGEGGMGKVYFGITPDGTRVAAKVIHAHLAGRQDVRARFDREILALQMVQGARISALVAASRPDTDQPWLAMEYVRGMNLRDYVNANGPLTAEMGAVLGELLVEALTAIHAAGLLHRDLKPANILLGPDGPKVIDFGLVGLAESAGELTASTDLLGSPVCMSPEQVSSARDVTPAADMYGLGASLLFALTAHYPYERKPIAALLNAISDPDTAPDLSGLPAMLAPVVETMVAYEAADRPTPSEALSTLRNLIDTSLTTARVHLVGVTYVEQPDDPPMDIEPPPAPARRRRGQQRVPSLAVSRLADRLRVGYDRSGSL